jgi:hypothetical protein
MDECFAGLTTAINHATAGGLQDPAGRLRAGSQGYLEYPRTASRHYLLLAAHPGLPRQNKGSGGDDPAAAAFQWPDGNFVLDHLITGLARPTTAGPPAAAGGPPADPHDSDEGCTS